MRYSKLTMLIPCALLLSACTTVTPAYKDNGPRTGSCVQGGPDSVAQQFYDYRIQHRSNDITALRPYLSDKLATLLSDASRDNSHRELLFRIMEHQPPIEFEECEHLGNPSRGGFGSTGKQ